MPRGRRKGSIAETLEHEIIKAQEKVIKTKVAHSNAVDALQKLLDKRDAQRKDELWNAYIKSRKSYESIMSYITEDPDENVK